MNGTGFQHKRTLYAERVFLVLRKNCSTTVYIFLSGMFIVFNNLKINSRINLNVQQFVQIESMLAYYRLFVVAIK